MWKMAVRSVMCVCLHQHTAHRTVITFVIPNGSFVPHVRYDSNCLYCVVAIAVVLFVCLVSVHFYYISGQKMWLHLMLW